MDIEYHLIRSDRRSIGIEVDREGKVTVRAPYSCEKKRIDRFLLEKENWIRQKVKLQKENARKRQEKREMPEAEKKYYRKLVLMPPGVLDYVVVHELAHRREMNHSAAFWKVVATWMPDYKKYRKWLRDNGNQF